MIKIYQKHPVKFSALPNQTWQKGCSKTENVNKLEKGQDKKGEDNFKIGHHWNFSLIKCVPLPSELLSIKRPHSGQWTQQHL